MIEFKPGRYFAGLWFGTHTFGNILAALWRDEGEELWHLDCRMRIVKDDVFGPESADKKTKFSGTSTNRRKLFNDFEEALGRLPFEMEYQPIEEDGPEWFTRRMRLKSLPYWMGIGKTLEPGQEPDAPEVDWSTGWGPLGL